MDAAFLKIAGELFNPGMGTENAAPLLHSLVRMTRPRRVLEVGLGYTSLFLLDALAKAEADYHEDMRVVQSETDAARRRGLLNQSGLPADYAPLLIGIDDFSLPGSGCAKVAAAAESLGLASRLKLLTGDFRDQLARLEKSDLPLDLVWFDCGSPRDGVDFLSLCWPLVAANGLLALHYTFWQTHLAFQGETRGSVLLPSPILNEIKWQQAGLGNDARFEVLSLLEPYKSRQGSVTLIRKLPALERYREQDLRAKLGSEGDFATKFDLGR